MPSESQNSVYTTQPEKPHHYTYLKEFRTQQCPLFLQHKCTQHRPFTCFHWHFLNQRRRRPVRKRDGTFGYSSDSYCSKYDETTGICPDGDECAFLHRTAGDTERRYHLRYYKTGTCVHETDSKGHCVKNGPHCAFAHGAHDLRQPVYDIRELQALEQALESQGPLETTAATQLEKDRLVNEDPKWNDTTYVLANYKTEQCKRPPRLCRQGYACPSYHNTRDRRRSPKKYKYRSTPCPNVKHGDDWGDPTQCDSGDGCPYCHTRTEQQFHPEIYKSTKCNDMVQTGYCPRGPFCAFAHVEQEMTTQREMNSLPDNSLAAFVTNALPGQDNGGKISPPSHENNIGDYQPLFSMGNQMNGKDSIVTTNGGLVNSNPKESIFNDMNTELLKLKLRQHMHDIDQDPTLDAAEKQKRKHNLFLVHNISLAQIQGGVSNMGSSSTTPSSTMSPHAPSFYPPGDTVESVIGNALDEDLNLGELSLSCIEKDLKEPENDANSVSSSYSTSFPGSGGYFGPSSLPVTIPSSSANDNRVVGSFSQSPVLSPLSSLSTGSFLSQQLQQQQQHKQEQQLQEAAAAFLSQPNPGKYSAPGYNELNSMSPHTNGISQSPLVGSNPLTANGGFGEMQRLKEELSVNKAKIAQWEEGISQARNACDAWKKEAEDAIRKMKMGEEEKQLAYKQRDEALAQITKLNKDIENLRGGPFIHRLQRVNELENLPVTILKQLHTQLRLDLETLEKVIYKQTALKCIVCQEKTRSMAMLPCNHFVACETCAPKQNNCPLCHSHIAQRTSVTLTM